MSPCAEKSPFSEEIIAARQPPMARNTITDPDRFRAEMHRVRAQGCAVDDHEFEDTMRCIAAPIFERDGRVQVGISISGPDSRFTFDRLDELRQTLVGATWELSERLGGAPWRNNVSTLQQ